MCCLPAHLSLLLPEHEDAQWLAEPKLRFLFASIKNDFRAVALGILRPGISFMTSLLATLATGAVLPAISDSV